MPRSREPVLVIVLVAATKYLIEAVSRMEGLFDGQFEGSVHYGRKVMVAGACGGTHSQEAEGDGCWCSAHVFIQSRTPVHGMVPPTFRMGLPTSTHLT